MFHSTESTIPSLGCQACRFEVIHGQFLKSDGLFSMILAHAGPSDCTGNNEDNSYCIIPCHTEFKLENIFAAWLLKGSV